VARVKMIIFTLSGFMAAFAGLVLAGRFGSTRPDIATGMELDVITAVVLGGVSISGGSGTMPGAILSLILIGLLRFGMGLLNIQGQVQGMAIGLLLILSILLPNIIRDLSASSKKVNRRTLLIALLVIIIFGLFFTFFFWSRAPVLATV
jgi:rhamnose transport system permease protein